MKFGFYTCHVLNPGCWDFGGPLDQPTGTYFCLKLWLESWLFRQGQHLIAVIAVITILQSSQYCKICCLPWNLLLIAKYRKTCCSPQRIARKPLLCNKLQIYPISWYRSWFISIFTIHVGFLTKQYYFYKQTVLIWPNGTQDLTKRY